MRNVLAVMVLMLNAPAVATAQLGHDVAAYIARSGVKHPEIVLRQAILETGWFTSKMCVEKNNLFGFRSNGPYFTFESWQACVDYYAAWQAKRYTDESEDYYAFLERIRFATSPDYTRELKRIRLRELSEHLVAE